MGSENLAYFTYSNVSLIVAEKNTNLCLAVK